MSSNPFRRSETSSTSFASSSNRSTLATITTSPNDVFHGEKTSKSNKHVRIVTPPPLSPDSTNEEALSRQTSYEGRTPSPPPEAAPAREYFDAHGACSTNPFGQTSDTNVILLDQEVIDNTRRNSDTSHGSPYRPVGETVANPFKRISAQGKQAFMFTAGDLEERNLERDNPTAARIDVDSFTRMLLTGSSPPNILTSELGQPNLNQQSGDAGTTTSPVYRQLPFEAASNRISLYSDSSRGTPEEDISRLRPRKLGPPPPAPRRVKGSALGAKQSQNAVSNKVEQADANLPSKTHKKSLPPTPSGNKSVPHNSNEVRLTEIIPASTKRRSLQDPIVSTVSHDVTANSRSETQDKKVGPAPPLSRRSSQIRSSLNNRMQGDSNFHNYFMHEVDHEDPTQSLVKNISGEYTKPPAPGPHSRFHAPSNNRSDDLPVLYQTSDMFSLSDKANAPPPPPPRRRGSSRSSLDHQAITGPEPLLTSTTNAEKDVLADLRELQTEVDALRNKCR